MPNSRSPRSWGDRRQVRIFGLLLVVALVGALVIGLMEVTGQGRQATPAPLITSEASPSAVSPTPSLSTLPASAPPTPSPSPRLTPLPSPRVTLTPRPGTPHPSTPHPSTPHPSTPPTARPTHSAASPRPTRHPSATPSASRPAPQPPTPAKKLPVGSRGTVYLTFDDGPSAYTQSILGILTRTKSTATFFQMGIRRPHYPQATAAILAQGHNIGNHTYDHADLTKLSPKGVRRELAGGPRVSCARPPYGATNATVRRILREQGYRQILWTVDSLDWTRPGVDWIVFRGAPADIHSGSIILMHDGGGPREQSVAALPRIIANLHDRGFRLRKLPGC